MLVSLAKRFLAAPDVWSLFHQCWRSLRRHRATHDAFERVLARSDDRLLDDVGLDRQAAHRLIGETPLAPHRAWDRWQF